MTSPAATAATAPRTPEFAARLEQLLAANHLSQRNFAAAIGTREGNISRWIHGGRPELVNVWRIADYFGEDRNTLATLAGYPPNTPTTTLDADGLDPEIVAMFEAELHRTHELLQGIPVAYWRTVLEAGRTGRRLAAEVALEILADPPGADRPSPPARRATRRRRQAVA